MSKVDYAKLAQFDSTSLRDLEHTMMAQMRREVEAKKAEERRKAKKARKKKRFAAR